MRVILLACLWVAAISQPAFLLSNESLSRRSLDRFRVGHPKNSICWDRNGLDGNLNIIDVHNHFQPFGGAEVPFEMYLMWMRRNGILFTNMMGLGQQLVQKNKEDPACCYYLHCPTFNYTVEPSSYNDKRNALNYRDLYVNVSSLNSQIYLLPSMTFPNMQQSQANADNLFTLLTEFPDTFKWIGEVNIFKHALAANGFFTSTPITEESVNRGDLDSVLLYAKVSGIPTTLHCDIGCDNYESVPNAPYHCHTPPEDEQKAHIDATWWKNLLGPFFGGFFNETLHPRPSFSKIQHLKVFDTILTRYPDLKVIWSHMGLSKELVTLHPSLHTRILLSMFASHRNLYSDISWDIVANTFFLNYNNESLDFLQPGIHPDFPVTDAHPFFSLFDAARIESRRKQLQATWDAQKKIPGFYVNPALGGPTFHLAIFFESINSMRRRLVTGTDFVASFSNGSAFPGLPAYNNPARGCMKTSHIHSAQVSDTSLINVFFSDDSFQAIVLGGNFFTLAGMTQFTTPKICTSGADLNTFLLIPALVCLFLAQF